MNKDFIRNGLIAVGLSNIRQREITMTSLKLTPEQIASKVRKDKPDKMAVLPLLTSFSGRIARGQFVSWYIPILLLHIFGSIYSVTFGGLILIATLWPLFALTTKRYHDFGQAGWMGVFQLIPWAGVLIVLAHCGMSIGNFNDNRFGKSLYRK